MVDNVHEDDIDDDDDDMANPYNIDSGLDDTDDELDEEDDEVY